MASVPTNVLKLNCDWRPHSAQNVLKQTHGFIWKGNVKIKRSALINGVENGEPRMIHIESMISAQRVMALKKYFGDGNSSWKNILDEFLCNVGRKFILFVTSTLVNSRYIAAFSKERFDACSQLKNSNVVSYENVIDQIIWNNTNIVDNQFPRNIYFLRELLKLGTW